MRFHLLVAAALLLLAVHGQAQTPPAPPRTVVDILAVLDQHKQESALEKIRPQANESPPSGKSGQELAVFYHRRGRANGALGNSPQSIADFENALELVLPSPDISRK